MVIFHSYVNVCQRVELNIMEDLQWDQWVCKLLANWDVRPSATELIHLHPHCIPCWMVKSHYIYINPYVLWLTSTKQQMIMGCPVRAQPALDALSSCPWCNKTGPTSGLGEQITGWENHWMKPSWISNETKGFLGFLPKRNVKINPNTKKTLKKPRSKKQNIHSALSTSPSGTCNLPGPTGIPSQVFWLADRCGIPTETMSWSPSATSKMSKPQIWT